MLIPSRRTLKFIAVVLICCASLAQAQTARTDAEWQAKKADLLKLLEVTGAVSTAMGTIDSNIASVRKMTPELPDEFFIEFKKLFTAEELTNALLPVFDRHYSHDEVKQLIAFYSTPLGKRVLDEQPKLLQECGEAGQRLGQDLARRIVQDLQARGIELRKPASAPARP